MESVAVIGAGIGGLAVALSLKGTGRSVVLIERDPQPPRVAPEAAFDAWARPGVPQFRHPHLFLARLHSTLRDRHPELLSELIEAGLEPSTLQEVLPPSLRDGVEPIPADRDLVHLWGRRATFEYVLRRHVERLPNVRFVHSARAIGLVTETTERQIRVRGVRISRDGREEVVDADVVVDASGKRTRSPEWLNALGAEVTAEHKPSGFAYSCRHYRLKNPLASPPRLDGGGNFGYLGYTTFYAERGNFALTFGCPVDEDALWHSIRTPEGFDRLSDRLPVLKRWKGEAVATSKVFGAGRFENRWTRYRAKRGREVVGFFAVGDSYIETNPMYGRGCASAFVQAEVLGETLAQTEDPSLRARRYYARSRNLLQPFFDVSVSTDRLYRARAKLLRGAAVPLGDRFLCYAFDAAWTPAASRSALVAREFLKAVEMREISSIGLRLAVLFHILWAFIVSLLSREHKVPLPLPDGDIVESLPEHRDTAVSA